MSDFVRTILEQDHKLQSLTDKNASLREQLEAAERERGILKEKVARMESSVIAANTAEHTIERYAEEIDDLKKERDEYKRRLELWLSLKKVRQTEQERDDALKREAALRAFVTSIEWVNSGYDFDHCLFCGGRKTTGHNEPCKLIQALSANPAPDVVVVRREDWLRHQEHVWREWQEHMKGCSACSNDEFDGRCEHGLYLGGLITIEYMETRSEEQQ